MLPAAIYVTVRCQISEVQKPHSKHTKLMPALVTSYELQPGNGTGMFLTNDLYIARINKWIAVYYCPGARTGHLYLWKWN